MNEQCPNCGWWLIGDGYTVVRHCPNADVPLDAAPDDRTILCYLDKEEAAEIFSDEHRNE